MYIYTPLCRYWIALYRYVLVFIVPHVDIELEDNKQFISNIPRNVLCLKKYCKRIFLTQSQFYHNNPSGHTSLYNVVSTSMQRHDVASTLMRRCMNDICTLERNA